MIDAILCWPQYADYPLWRRWHAANAWRLNRTFIVFTPHAGPDLRDFVRANVAAEFIDSPDDGEWRDCAVNAALDRSTADIVWFTEQDLTIDDRFWDHAFRNALGFRDGTGRWHPASLMVRRSYIDQTSRYFGPDPVDHFYRFSQELDRLTLVDHLRGGYRHMQGESQNQYLRQTGQEAGFFRRDEWRDYLRACLGVTPLHPDWERWARQEIG